jgi:hypothetical protein
MSGLLPLTVEDFELRRSSNGSPVLCNKITNSFSLVFYYSTACQHCQTFLPRFKNLPKMVMGCQFGIVNISDRRNVQIIEMSKNTITPLEYVPYIVLYLRGEPYMQYDGLYDENIVVRFLNSVMEDLRKKFEHRNANTLVQKPKQDTTTNGQPIIGFDFKKYLTESECLRLLEKEQGTSKRR